MSNPATISDLEERFRPLTPAEAIVATATLADAWEVVQRRVYDLEERRAAGGLSDGLVRRVVAAMAVRALPQALRATQGLAGVKDWSIDDATFRLDTTSSTGGLYLTDEELALLVGESPTNRGAFTIHPGRRRC